jgi:hypothetical protein
MRQDGNILSIAPTQEIVAAEKLEIESEIEKLELQQMLKKLREE